MDAVIRIASIVAGQDFAAERARIMDLSALTREQLAAFCEVARMPVEATASGG